VYKLWSSSLCSLLQLPATSSLSGSNIFLCNLFSDTLNVELNFVHNGFNGFPTVAQCPNPVCDSIVNHVKAKLQMNRILPSRCDILGCIQEFAD
jgi:hypothetical protein